MFSLKQVAGPGTAYLDLAEVKSHLRVTGTDEDTLIQTLMNVAMNRVDGKDGIMGRALITQTWDFFADWRFPHLYEPIEIPLAPLQSVTWIKYTDINGALQTVDPSLYTVDYDTAPSRILPAYQQYWPPTRYQMKAINIRGVFGYGDTVGTVPDTYKLAMFLHIGHLYAHREEVADYSLFPVPNSYDALLAPLRVRRF